MSGVFATWQPRYAKSGVPTFPVVKKKPATKGYLRTGLQGSAQLALKFPDAEAFGFACGPRSRLTIVDVDSPDDAIMREAERLFGSSPVIWRTGSGNAAIAFRHNREERRVRPIPGLPIDVLGGGYAVAPPSMGARRAYEFIRGGLADFDRLPIARIPLEVANSDTPQRTAARIPKGRRNVELFAHLKRHVNHCDDFDTFLDVGRTWNSSRPVLALPNAEVVKTCRSVWDYQGGRRKIMHRLLVDSLQFDRLASDPKILGVVAFLAAENGPESEFMIADGLGAKRGWPRSLVPAARRIMLELRVVEPTGRRSGRYGPHLYRWRLPSPPP